MSLLKYMGGGEEKPQKKKKDEKKNIDDKQAKKTQPIKPKANPIEPQISPEPEMPKIVPIEHLEIPPISPEFKKTRDFEIKLRNLRHFLGLIITDLERLQSPLIYIEDLEKLEQFIKELRSDLKKNYQKEEPKKKKKDLHPEDIFEAKMIHESY